MTVLSYTNAFLGIPYPNRKSGQTSVTSYLYPGALQPQKRNPDTGTAKASQAFLGINYPNRKSGASSVRSYLYPGAVQPQQQLAVVVFDVAGWAEVEWG